MTRSNYIYDLIHIYILIVKLYMCKFNLLVYKVLMVDTNDLTRSNETHFSLSE